MKPTQEKILSSIQENKSKKELLSVQKVELGAIDDLKKLTNSLRDNVKTQKDLSSKKRKINSEVDTLVKQNDKIVNEGRKLQSSSQKLSREAAILSGNIEKSAKELGINPKSIPDLKEWSDLFTETLSVDNEVVDKIKITYVSG